MYTIYVCMYCHFIVSNFSKKHNYIYIGFSKNNPVNFPDFFMRWYIQQLRYINKCIPIYSNNTILLEARAVGYSNITIYKIE